MSNTRACTPSASDYDREVEQKGWRGPEVVFGLAYSQIAPDHRLLDIGIGTGLGSLLFHKAGLRISGMDVCPEMLSACRAKGFAEDLRQHDLLVAPYPFADASMDHVISVGVLNHFRNLEVVFAEAARILRDDGTFAFMVLDRPQHEPAELELNLEHTRPGACATLYRHGAGDVDSLLAASFALLKLVEFTVYLAPGRTHPATAKAIIARRKERT